jgi:MFS family permease
MLSLCHNLWECILAQGFCLGIGAGCLFVPAVAIMPSYFSSRLGLAIGLAASGSSMGGIIYPIMFYKLIAEVGFGWSVRILGFTVLATLMLPLFCMQMRVKPPKARAVLDTTAFTDLPFLMVVFALMVGFIGLYVGIFYTSYFGQASGYTDASLSFYLVPILNAGSVLGRTVPNWVSDKIGPLNVMIPGKICTVVLLLCDRSLANMEEGSLLLGAVLLCNLAVHNAAGLICTALFFGFFSGIFIALPTGKFVK